MSLTLRAMRTLGVKWSGVSHHLSPALVSFPHCPGHEPCADTFVFLRLCVWPVVASSESDCNAMHVCLGVVPCNGSSACDLSNYARSQSNQPQQHSLQTCMQSSEHG